MIPHLAIPVFAAMLVADNPPPVTADMLADVYGRTLGAASSCPSIPTPRLEADTKKAADHLKKVAGSDQDASDAGLEMTRALADGKRDVETGYETCAQAASELANLEYDLAK